MNGADGPTVLLTGASGVLGRAFVEELCADVDLVCLRQYHPVGDSRVTEVAGDLSVERLGLGAREWTRLARRTGAVLHAAAVTSWRAAPEDIVATNVAGTRRVLEFARAAGCPLYFVSTAFLARPFSASGDDSAGPSAYLKSKVEAERLLRDSGHPVVIVRPSIVIGDSRDGRIAAFQGIHRAAASVVAGLAPIIPAEPGSLVDALPQDVVAAATAALIRRRVTGGEYWLTAGDQALTVGDMLDACLRVAERFGPRPARPRLIPTEAVGRLLLPLMEDVRAHPASRLRAAARGVRRHCSAAGSTDSTASGINRPDLCSYLTKNGATIHAATAHHLPAGGPARRGRPGTRRAGPGSTRAPAHAGPGCAPGGPTGHRRWRSSSGTGRTSA
jgi:nucleoside-diphosphate-sugar epimerase